MIECFLSCNNPYEFQDFEQSHCTACKLNQTGIATTKLIHKTNSATNAKFTIKKCCLVVIYKTLTQKVDTPHSPIVNSTVARLGCCLRENIQSFVFFFRIHIYDISKTWTKIYNARYVLTKRQE